MKFTFKLTKGPSTENAIASITAALDELDAVVEAENAEVARLDTEIEAKVAAQGEAKERADRASKIAKRFAKLVA